MPGNNASELYGQGHSDALRTMWKKPAQKSIRETSVDIWFMMRPLVSFERALDVSRRDRE